MHLRKAPFYSPRGCRFKLLLLLLAYTMISARHRFRCWSEFPIVSQKAYTVYICGYNFSRLAGVLFPDAEIKRWREHGLSYPSDVLLASGYHCSGFSSYHGKILYVDGENGVLPTQFEGMPHLFYLGPSTPKNHQGPSLQLFHVAHTTLFHPYDSVDFLNRRVGNISPRFLVYINSHCVDFREQTFDSISELARREHIELPEARGVCKGHDGRNVWKPIGEYDKRLTKVVDVMSEYRFALVMENSNAPGYVTEKIANAFMAGTIPVYYGTKDVFRLFNPDAFIYYDIEEPQKALKEILYLEKDRSAYRVKRDQLVLRDAETTLANYFSLQDDIGHGALKYKVRRMLKAC